MADGSDTTHDAASPPDPRLLGDLQAAIRYGRLCSVARILDDQAYDAASQGSYEERDHINTASIAVLDAMAKCTATLWAERPRQVKP